MGVFVVLGFYIVCRLYVNFIIVVKLYVMLLVVYEIEFNVVTILLFKNKFYNLEINFYFKY